MNYFICVSLTLGCIGSVYLNAYNKEHLKRFAQTGNGYRADLRGANLAPIIKELRKKEDPCHGISLREAHLEGGILS